MENKFNQSIKSTFSFISFKTGYLVILYMQKSSFLKIKHCIEMQASLGVIQYLGYPLNHIRYIYRLAGKEQELLKYINEKFTVYKFKL